LETKLNALSDYLKELEVVLSYDEIKSDIEKAYKREQKKISMPGFRKGKVPLSIIKKYYGEAIEYSAAEKIAENKAWDAIDSTGEKPISIPKFAEIDYKGEDGLVFKVQFEVKPKIEPKDYTGLEIEKIVFDVDDNLIEEELKRLQKSKATYEEAEKVEDRNYRIYVDLQRVDENGNPFPNSEPSKDLPIDLSEPNINAELIESTLGKKVGDEFEFTFVDEHKHGDEVHKTEYRYKGVIKKIEKIVLPEITDEFIKEATDGKHETVESYKKEIYDYFRNYYDEQSEEMMINSLLTKISQNNDFDVPPGHVELVLKRLVDYEIENAKRYNQPVPDEKQLREQLKEKAAWNAKWQLLMEAIAEKEGIEVTEEDLKKIAEEEAEKTGISVDKLVKFYKDSGKEATILEDKVIEFLKENNTIKEVNIKEKEKEQAEKKAEEENKTEEKSDE
jgi:trigger factor